MTIGPENSFHPYLPIEEDFPDDMKLFREILSNRERLTANIVNVKENAQYEKQELVTAQRWFTTSSGGALVYSDVFRLTFDLVALNGGVPIPVGAPTFDLVLLVNPQPAPINIPTAIFPVHGFGAAISGAPTNQFFFINDPLLYVRTNIWTNLTQQITITNNTGAALSWCVWVFEYIKT